MNFKMRNSIFNHKNNQYIYHKNNSKQLFLVQRTSELHLNFSSIPSCKGLLPV